MLIPFKNGDLWHLNLGSEFLNSDEKIESFLYRNASVEPKRLIVYGDLDSDDAEKPENPVLRIEEVFHAQCLDKFANQLVAFVRVEGVEVSIL